MPERGSRQKPWGFSPWYRPWASTLGNLLGLSLGNYLLPVDYTGRLVRQGKTAMSAELSGILERLGTTAETWQARPDDPIPKQ
jgi:hypothetical protein